MFINLLTHSHYSLLNSSISIDDIVAFALKNKQKYVSLIDINTMYGTMEFYNKAIANKLVPIIGLQITYNNQKAVLVAKNYDGYKQLVLISSFVMTNETFEINSFLNNVYVLVDDIDSAIFINNRNSVFSLNQTKRRPIATRECFFENKGDLQSFKAVLAIRDEKQLVEFDNVNDFDNNYMLNEKEVNNFYSKESLNNLEELLSNCSLDMPAHNKINFVRYDEKIQSNILLQTKCKEGLKHRLNSTQAPHIYIERLKKELDIIDQMHFNDYFLVVQDYVNFAKQNGILVGPGRGSAAGSLVAYTLGITEIDPIKYDLIFERFLNPERATMPDIDIDFMDNRRNEVVEYMFERYGHKRVAHIITFQRMKAKMAIRDIGRILDIDLPIINNISKSIPMEYELDITGAIENSKVVASYAKKYPQLFTLATKLVNAPRQIGLHAAGVVVTNNEMDEIIPIQTSSDGLNVTQYSMEYLENLGLIKMDILGLVNLSTINECIKLIKVNHSINIDLSKIPLNDKKTFNQLSKGDTTGIFQLESPGMRNLIVKIKPTSIEDISITSALFRPGPQKNIPTYLQNKAHPHSINYLNNDFKEVLSSTHNIIIYQEQIIQLVQKVANFSLADADLFRRAISKKNAEKLASLQKQFIDGGIKNNYSKEELTKIFDYIFEFANYGFNHSHSLAYAYVSYWMAYLKTHCPLEFFTTLLTSSENSVDKISQYIREVKQCGTEVLPPSIVSSNHSFTINKKAIIFGFNVIKNIGYETANKILEVRTKHKFSDLQQTLYLLTNNGIGIKTLEILIKAGCFDCFLEEHSRFWLLNNLPSLFKSIQSMTKDGEVLIEPHFENNEGSQEDIKQLNDEQYILLGVSFEEHPIKKIKQNYHGEYEIIDLSVAENDINNVSHCLVSLKSFRVIKTKTNKTMCFIKVEDDTKACDVTVFPTIYDKAKDILKDDNLFIITVKATERGLQAFSIKEYHEK